MESTTYDAIVSDYEMPEKNGLEFLKELRETEKRNSFYLVYGKRQRRSCS